MMAAKPIIAVANEQSDLAAIVQESGCGWVVKPGALEELRDRMQAVTELAHDIRCAIGARGRMYALENFVTEACLPRVISLLEEAVNIHNSESGSNK
jgi:glycosyltransferase involved in cell wall biosynthesis